MFIPNLQTPGLAHFVGEVILDWGEVAVCMFQDHVLEIEDLPAELIDIRHQRAAPRRHLLFLSLKPLYLCLDLVTVSPRRCSIALADGGARGAAGVRGAPIESGATGATHRREGRGVCGGGGLRRKLEI